MSLSLGIQANVARPLEELVDEGVTHVFDEFSRDGAVFVIRRDQYGTPITKVRPDCTTEYECVDVQTGNSHWQQGHWEFVSAKARMEITS